ncbi:MAG: squalene/phytoene synthase family protein [Acidimicrobiales bacterium]
MAGAIMDRAAGENFPVAPRVLPGRYRGALLGAYGFARLADEIGDAPPGARDPLAELDWLEAELRMAFSAGHAHPLVAHPLVAGLARACSPLGVPMEPFLLLIEANRRDQVVTGYASFAELEEYCQLSAVPVGEVVLHIFGAATPERQRLSASVCTGLQLVEHCQDIPEDLGRGRVYMPRDDMAAAGCSEADLEASPATAPLRRLLRLETTRARRLLAAGGPLAASLRGWARLAVAAYAAGGLAACDAIEASGFDVTSGPPAPRRATLLAHWGRMALGRSGRMALGEREDMALGERQEPSRWQ